MSVPTTISTAGSNIYTKGIIAKAGTGNDPSPVTMATVPQAIHSQSMESNKRHLGWCGRDGDRAVVPVIEDSRY